MKYTEWANAAVQNIVTVHGGYEIADLHVSEHGFVVTVMTTELRRAGFMPTPTAPPAATTPAAPQ